MESRKIINVHYNCHQTRKDLTTLETSKRTVVNIYEIKISTIHIYDNWKKYPLPPWSQQQTRIEPVHEISNNVVCATSKASDQPAHTRSLIRAFASRLSILWLLSY